MYIKIINLYIYINIYMCIYNIYIYIYIYICQYFNICNGAMLTVFAEISVFC